MAVATIAGLRTGPAVLLLPVDHARLDFFSFQLHVSSDAEAFNDKPRRYERHGPKSKVEVDAADVCHDRNACNSVLLIVT